ncbi:RNA polymerase sigma factor [Orrella sp. JC864]|uniref:RNA polymerase sigma factor n=1 Tax=Orrella sp. JC864 TaxID=3120298 RepID=UPI0012BB8314
MSGGGLARLSALLVERYDALRNQVARRLGASGDMAADALHEAYVRLAGRDDLDTVRHPQTYLVNTAVHAAIDQLRSDVRLVSGEEINELFDLPDECADPARMVQNRREMDRMMTVLAQLPPRQRALLVDSRVHGTPRSELARRWGISVTLVGREIQAAHRHCARALEDLEEGGEAGKHA